MSVAAAQPVQLGVRLTKLADWLAVAAAVSLPWSTSVTSILTGVWAIVALLTLDRESLERVRFMAAVLLPLAIAVYAILAVAWSDVAWPVRMHSLPSVVKLAVIPLFLIHFRRTGAYGPVFVGFFVSCCALLAASWLMVLLDRSIARGPGYGVPVKDYISQSGFFSICVVALLDRAIAIWRESSRTALLYIGGAVLFLANIVFVATGRTSLIVLAVLLLLLGASRFRGRSLMLFFGVIVAVAAVVWFSSPYLRYRITNVMAEIHSFGSGVDTSSGARLEFWTHSLSIVREAPLFGHGAGSTREAMSRSFGVDSTLKGAPSNPHNQIFAVAIPYGLIGVVLLIAMWVAHLRLFTASGFLSQGPVAFIGLAIVVQNIVGGLFNSHLFDFTQGWFYVMGVGIAGGALLYRRDAQGSNTR
jgi:O-antigen ligase